MYTQNNSLFIIPLMEDNIKSKILIINHTYIRYLYSKTAAILRIPRVVFERRRDRVLSCYLVGQNEQKSFLIRPLQFIYEHFVPCHMPLYMAEDVLRLPKLPDMKRHKPDLLTVSRRLVKIHVSSLVRKFIQSREKPLSRPLADRKLLPVFEDEYRPLLRPSCFPLTLHRYLIHRSLLSCLAK